MSTTPQRQALRDLLNRHELIIAPGVFDGISAQLARRTGHVAAYMTGAGVAASGYALPDIGLVTQTEMTERARMIVSALGDVPLIADADTGYGAGLNVVRTVRQYDDAGVAAIQLEDQVFPKRCGHLPDKQVVDAATFVQTLHAALDTRSDEDMLVVARTDARAPLGLDAAIERANQYARAGADIIFGEAPQGIDEDRADRPRNRGPAADQPGPGRHDPAGVVGAAAGSGVRDRDSPVESAGARHLRHAGRAVRTQWRQSRRLRANISRRFLQPRRHGRLAGPR